MADSAAEEGPRERLERVVLRLASWPWILLPLLLAWSTAVPCGLVLDDVILIERDPRVRELRLLEILSGPLHPAEHGGARGGLYRPVLLLSYALEQAIHGSPAAMHAANVLLHLAVCLALRPIAATLLGPRGTAAAVLLFLVHPLHTEAVTWLVGRAEVLALLFALLAWRAALLAGAKGGGWHAAAAAAMTAALLSKESALAVIPAVTTHAWVLARRQGEPATRGALVATAPLVVGLLLALALRLVALGPHLSPAQAMEIPASLNPVAAQPLDVRLATGLVLLARYGWLCVAPIRLVADYSFDALPVEPGFLAWRPLLVLLGLGLALAWSVRLARRGEPLPLLCLTWFGLLLGLVLQVVPIGAMFGERFAYAPSLAACLLAGWVYERSRRPPAAVLLAVALAFAARTALRNLDWRDGETFYAVTARDQPRSAQAQLWHALVLLGKGDPQAVWRLRQAREIDPAQPWAARMLGRCLRRSGQPGEALAHLDDAVRLAPDDGRPLVERMLCHAALGRREEARADLAKARALGLAPEAVVGARGELRALGWTELARELGEE